MNVAEAERGRSVDAERLRFPSRTPSPYFGFGYPEDLLLGRNSPWVEPEAGTMLFHAEDGLPALCTPHSGQHAAYDAFMVERCTGWMELQAPSQSPTLGEGIEALIELGRSLGADLSDDKTGETRGSDGDRESLASRGSLGHPYMCAEACKFTKRSRGCQDGVDCAHCHLCVWKKHDARQRRRNASLSYFTSW
eukprot:TRINITY_DN81356_c0_g1_i1.p1 TRINITY_DN81356_c0_g1~~TRINITY_DN81356_c0_g1_i1.p1  ORF type:complete len:193 (-),score=26.13 TRINITY_DN81356_c0_g1_i1:305-883(-)